MLRTLTVANGKVSSFNNKYTKYKRLFKVNIELQTLQTSALSGAIICQSNSVSYDTTMTNAVLTQLMK